MNFLVLVNHGHVELICFLVLILTKSREWITTTWPWFSKSREQIIIFCTQFA